MERRKGELRLAGVAVGMISVIARLLTSGEIGGLANDHVRRGGTPGRLSALVVAALFALAPSARTEDAGGVPGVVVGIGSFLASGGSDPCHVHLLLAQALEPFGFEARHVEVGDDPELALSAERGIDYLVTGSVLEVDVRSAQARVDSRDGMARQSFAATGPDACESIVDQVVQYLGSRGTVWSYVVARRSDAEQRLEEDPDDFESLFILGLAHRFAGEWAEALRSFSRAAEIRPLDARVHFNLALCYKSLGDDDLRLRHLEEARRLDPGNESVAIALGNYWLGHGRFDRATGHYERCLDSAKTSALARWNLAVLHSRQGDLARARELLGEIPASSPWFEEARAWAVRIEEQERRDASLFGPRTSFWGWLGLEKFGVTVLSVTLALLLAAFLPGRAKGGGFEVGPVKVPPLPSSTRKRLQIVAPLLLAVGLALFVPWLRLETLDLERPLLEPSVDVAQAVAPSTAPPSEDR